MKYTKACCIEISIQHIINASEIMNLASRARHAVRPRERVADLVRRRLVEVDPGERDLG